MTTRPTATDGALFILMSLVWGSTWVASKIGIAAMPPIFFAALRFCLVAILVFASVRGTTELLRGPARYRVWVTGLLVNTATYALILSGMTQVASGVSGLVNLTVVVVGLYALALIIGDERPSWRLALALLLGLCGLVVLFFERIGIQNGEREIWGVVAIIAGSLSYCVGSVLSRPLLDTATPLQVTGAQALTGGCGLVALSIAIEPIGLTTFAVLLELKPAASLAYMVIFGTFVAYTIYLRLMRNWGSVRAGLYAFVSPVVALVLGHIVFNEPLGWPQMVGAMLLLTAAAVAIWRPSEAAG